MVYYFRKLYFFEGVRYIMGKNMEKELFLAKEAAQKADRSKREFFSRMSHEIRTPMNAIIGMTHIAKNTKDSQKIVYCLDKIDEASKQLLAVINNILDMSDIEAYELELYDEEFDLTEMLMYIAQTINESAAQKKQNMRLYVDGPVPRFIVGDKERIEQVIVNLLSNSVKFTPLNGNIQLRVYKSGQSGLYAKLLFEVVDDGIGIAKQKQALLFDSFEQADSGISRRYDGTGLGLYIIRHIVELMKGTIWVDSVPGEGSKFSFTIEALEGKKTAEKQSGYLFDKYNNAEEEPARQAEGRVIMEQDAIYAVVHVKEGLKRLMNNKKLYLTLLRSFKGKQMVEECIKGIDEDDSNRALQGAHALKGVAANLGLVPLQKAAGQLEELLKNNQDAKSLKPVLLQELDRVTEAIQQLISNEELIK